MPVAVSSVTTFFIDRHHINRVTAASNIRTLCYRRLNLLEQEFILHLMLNADKEFVAQKSAPHRDFYNVRKVNTHVHHSACINQKHLVRFIKSKLRKEPDEVVILRDGTYLTLKEIVESLDLTGYNLNVDLLDVRAHKSTFHRFDKFNLRLLVWIWLTMRASLHCTLKFIKCWSNHVVFRPLKQVKTQTNTNLVKQSIH